MLKKMYEELQDRLDKMESLIDKGIAEGEQSEDKSFLQYFYDLKTMIERVRE